MAFENTITTPEGATPSFAERIGAILARHNEEIAKLDEEFRESHPEEFEAPTPPATIADVLFSLSAANVGNNYGLVHNYVGVRDTMQTILDEFMEEIAGAEVDPWPGLDREELRFLVGDRVGRRDCPFQLYLVMTSGSDAPLTFGEKVLAARHRKWLEKGAEAKRKRLEKARATVAELTKPEGRNCV